MTSKNFFGAGVFASAVVLSIIVLESIYTRGFATHGFPAMLFSALWALAFAAAHLAERIFLRPTRGSASSAPARVVGTVLLLITIAVFSGIVVDQMPCFLGVPNCD